MSTRPPDLSDLELLRVWRANGDDGAFHVLVLRHFDPVVNFVRGYVGRDLAADIAQNAFLRLVERADELLAGGGPPAGAPPRPIPVAEPLARSLRGWLLKVARNSAIDYRRRFFRQRNETELAAAARLLGAAAGEPPPARGDYRLPALEACVEKLPEEYADLVRLYFFEGQTQDAIAAIFGVTGGAICRRLEAARRWLRCCVERQDHPRT